MLPMWFQAMLMVLFEAWAARRDVQIRFLKVQAEMLRERLPGNRVIVSPEERSRLLMLGAELNHQVDDLMGVVSVKTYKRWVRELKAGGSPIRVGRPKRMTASLRKLVLKLARENVGWGVRRIVGELRKLGLTSSRSSVQRLLISEGLLPDPERRAPKGVTTPWRTFINAHMDTLVACDFFSKTVWTPLGKRMAFCLMFIHLGTRKVFVSPATYHPTQGWVSQQAKNVTMWLEDEGLDCRFLIHDRDTKFTASFDQMFKANDCKIIKTPFQTPVANAYAESWIGSLKRECLNHFLCFSLGHLDHIVQTYANYYNDLRPHQSLGNVPLDQVGLPPPAAPIAGEIEPIRRRRILGGLLSHYERKAA
jgi:putative transposase